MVDISEYDGATTLEAFFPSKDERRLGRIWSVEATAHRLAAVGIISLFEGSGTDPTVLTGYASSKLWLQASAGVTDVPGTIRVYNGGDETDVANWPELTKELFYLHVGSQALLDEDNMVSDSAGSASSQQAVKAYNDKNFASTRTILKAADTSLSTLVYLSEAGREGYFKWRAGDYSSAITFDTGEGVFIKSDATASSAGAWVRVYDGVLRTSWFGAVGDGVADDYAACQSALNVAHGDLSIDIWTPASEIRFDGPYHRITEPLICGSGASFRGVVKLIGGRPKTRQESTRPGVVIVKDFAGSIGLIIQGVRDAIIQDIAIEGDTDVRDYPTTVGGGGMPSVRDESIWDGVGAGTQYAPEALVAIDPFVGAAPGVPYPDPTFPPGDVAPTYGRLQSSRVTFINVHFRNQEVGVAVTPSNSNSNGDFIKFYDCKFEALKFGVSAGNSQGRANAFYDCEFNTVHTAWTGIRHGQQTGRFDGVMRNCSAARLKQWFEFSDLATGANGARIEKCYVEDGWMLGTIVGGGGNEPTMVLDSCSLNVSSSRDDQPAWVIAGDTTGYIHLRNCVFGSGFDSMVGFQPRNVHCEGCTITPAAALDTSEKEYQRIFLGATCGFMFNISQTGGMREHIVRAISYDEDSNAPSSVLGWSHPDMNQNTSRDNVIPLWQWRFYAESTQLRWSSEPIIKRMTLPRTWTKVSGTPTSTQVQASLTDRTLTCTFGSLLTDYYAETTGGAAGDIIYDTASGTVFAVRSQSTTAVVAEQQNNYQEDGAGGYEVSDNAIDLTSGSIIIFNCRLFTPSIVFYGDFTTASATVPYYSGRNSDHASIDNASTGVVVGDRLFMDSLMDGMHLNDENRLTVIDSGGALLTFAGANARLDRTRYPMTLWIKTPPADEASR